MVGTFLGLLAKQARVHLGTMTLVLANRQKIIFSRLVIEALAKAAGTVVHVAQSADLGLVTAGCLYSPGRISAWPAQ